MVWNPQRKNNYFAKLLKISGQSFFPGFLRIHLAIHHRDVFSIFDRVCPIRAFDLLVPRLTRNAPQPIKYSNDQGAYQNEVDEQGRCILDNSADGPTTKGRVGSEMIKDPRQTESY